MRDAQVALHFGMVGQPGLEPGTSVLSGLRSNQLSYWPARLERTPGVLYRTIKRACILKLRRIVPPTSAAEGTIAFLSRLMA